MSMCDVYAANFIDCMKQKIKEKSYTSYKCKEEFDLWDSCNKNKYSDFLEFSNKPISLENDKIKKK